MHNEYDFDFLAALNGARSVYEFERMAEEAQVRNIARRIVADQMAREKCCGDQAYIANPLEYPLRCARHTAKVCAFTAVLGWGAAVWLAICAWMAGGAR